ncbi:MAG: RNA polymerase sigma factor [Actinobacteria bacterium]|nr:MAG: RNA polymerase sigma factor [Actinomycetota bacterium]
MRLITTQLDDSELVAAAQGGDRNALDQLLRRHYDRIHAVCRRVAGGTRDADDACQEALIKITRNLPRFDGRSSFATWAYRIATNASLDELRKRKRRPALHSVRDGDDVGQTSEIIDPMAEKRLQHVSDRLILDDALAQLPEDLRAAVVLRDVADLDYKEIAEALDIPVGTVKSRIARGRSALAKHLRLGDLPAIPTDTGNRDTGNERPIDST